MAVNYYESHLTLNTFNPLYPESILKELIEANNWRYSKIDGDINLGSGVKAYATRQFNARLNIEIILQELHSLANKLKDFGWTILRRKVELVMYDDRSSQVRVMCQGNCPECNSEDDKFIGHYHRIFRDKTWSGGAYFLTEGGNKASVNMCEECKKIIGQPNDNTPLFHHPV